MLVFGSISKGLSFRENRNNIHDIDFISDSEYFLYSDVPYQRSIVICMNKFFYKTISSIEQRIHKELFNDYVNQMFTVEYSHLILSIYLLIKELQYKDFETNKSIQAILSGHLSYMYENVWLNFTHIVDIPINYKLEGVDNLFRILTGFQYIFIKRWSDSAITRYRHKSKFYDRKFYIEKIFSDSNVAHDSLLVRMEDFRNIVIDMFIFLHKLDYTEDNEDNEVKGAWPTNSISFLEARKKQLWFCYYRITKPGEETEEGVEPASARTSANNADSPDRFRYVVDKAVLTLANSLGISNIPYQPLDTTDKSVVLDFILSCKYMTAEEFAKVMYRYKFNSQDIIFNGLVIFVNALIGNTTHDFPVIISRQSYQNLAYRAMRSGDLLKDALVQAVKDPNSKVIGTKNDDKPHILYYVIVY